MSDEKFDAAAFKKYREQTWIYQRDLTVEEAAQWGYDQLRADRDKWRDEYQNLCKFTTDYEDKREHLEGVVKEREWMASMHLKTVKDLEAEIESLHEAAAHNGKGAYDKIAQLEAKLEDEIEDTVINTMPREMYVALEKEIAGLKYTISEMQKALNKAYDRDK
jgi:predicted  nucleic acid-binding Zn-ribbon protein